MKVACIDLEGVLVPELWPHIAQMSGIEALSVTTREEPDYAALMHRRIALLREHGLRLHDVQEMISRIEPFPDALAFLQRLSTFYRLHIVSDCFYELAAPLLQALGSPEAYCHNLDTDDDGWIVRCRWANRSGKEQHVERLLAKNAQVLAVGDAFNDLAMLHLAQQGVLVRPSEHTRAASRGLPVVERLGTILGLVGILDQSSVPV